MTTAATTEHVTPTEGQTIVVPPKLADEIPKVTQWANAIVVDSSAACERVLEECRRVKRVYDDMVAFWVPLKRSADEHKRQVLAAERRTTTPFFEALAKAKEAVRVYQANEKRKAEERQRQLQAEADAKAERERQALLKKAAAAKRPETAARHEDAAAAIVSPAVTVSPEIPKVAGASTRKVWKFRVVAPELVPRSYLLVDEVSLGKLARALQEKASVPGVEFYYEETVAIQGG